MKNTVIMGVALAGVLSASAAAASYPAGVWVKVQGVTLEPNASSPTRIQIHGAAMLFDGSTGTSYAGYTEPALGYLYYECPSGDEKTCISEWADVEKNIKEPSDVCIGLGDQSIATGSLRSPGSPAATPDAYPIAYGVLPGFSPCQILETFLKSQPDGGAGAGGSAGAAGSPNVGGAAGVPGSGGSAGVAGSGGGSTGGAAGSAAGGGSGSGTGGASSGGASGSGTGGTASGGDSGDDGGCTLASGSTGSGLGFLGVALAAALALGRRRRS